MNREIFELLEFAGQQKKAALNGLLFYFSELINIS